MNPVALPQALLETLFQVMVKTTFLTNDKDQNSVASQMPTTLTVTCTVIIACVIETCTTFRPARPELSIAQVLLRASRPLLAIAPR